MCPWDPELHELRAECYIELGELSKAVHDLQPTTKLRNDNTAAHYKISQLLYQMGDADESLRYVLNHDLSSALHVPFCSFVACAFA